MSRSKRSEGSRSAAEAQIPYHKGNLRHKLLREAARMIAKSGVEAVSMRKLSDRLGISRTAAYHYFDNKGELLAAVGQHGFTRLADRVQAAGKPELPPLDNLRQALLAYVRFATEETEFFRLMFANVLQRPVQIGATAELSAFRFSSPEAFAVFDALLSAVKRCQADRCIRGGDPLVVANTLHAFIHGVARLAIDDHLKIQCSMEEFLDQGLDALFSGLGGPAQARLPQ
ncbi:MAG TPA: TetR/AcrR family transcriptional regulator [Bryobacteraceae bacterium]|nr:TetR/AcrR family transcriptional regulator [Bryobacteraceae bacterium]